MGGVALATQNPRVFLKSLCFPRGAGLPTTTLKKEHKSRYEAEAEPDLRTFLPTFYGFLKPTFNGMAGE